MQIFIEMKQNLDFDPYLTLFDPSFDEVKGALYNLKGFCVYCILQTIIEAIFFPQLDDVLVIEVGLVTTFTCKNEFWPPFGVKMTPNQNFFLLGFMFTLKLTYMQIFIEIGQNLDFDPHLTPIWSLI